MECVYNIPSSDDFLEEIAKLVKLHRDVRTIFLPNKRSCRELKKYLLKNDMAFLPKLTAISDVFSFGDQKIRVLLMGFLKEKNQNIPINTLYELSESLLSFIKELVLNAGEDFIPLIPDDLQKYWERTDAIINAAMNVTEIMENLSIWKEKLAFFLESIKTQKVIAAGIEEINGYIKSFLKIVKETGIVINFNYNEPCCAKNVESLEFDSQFEEGFGVAVAIRKAIFEKKSVLVVSPDKNLTEIIKSDLKRWSIIADDSKGEPFSKTTDGILISLVMDMLQKQYNVVPTINVLKMSSVPLTVVQELEAFFREQQMVPSNFFIAFDLCLKKDPSLVEQVDKMRSICVNSGSQNFSKWFEMYHEMVSVVNVKSAEKLKEITDQFFLHLDLLPAVGLDEFCVFFKNRVMSQSVRNPKGYTPNIMILGTIEAQLLNADLIIIADANEKSWVRSSGKNDFWMTKTMLKHFGIQSIREKNEFLKHIFERLICKENVLITRPILVDGVEQPKYKYFDKFTKNHKITEAIWLKELIFSMKKQETKVVKFNPPAPKLSLRPSHLWVSDIDLLINNPYAFYAKRILKLVEIDHINEAKNMRGNYIHKILEEFVKYSKNKSDIKKLHQIGKEFLQNKCLQIVHFGLWFFRLNKIFSFIAENFIGNTIRCYPEIIGSCSFHISDDYYVNISCRADRIDIDDVGNISVVDYKTGPAPAKSKVETGEKIQLLIESIIAKNGGFGFEETEVNSLYFWQLTGSNDGNKIVCIADNGDEVSKLNEIALNKLKELIYRYNIAGEPYMVNIYSPYENSYMHLARVKEWGNAR